MVVPPSAKGAFVYDGRVVIMMATGGSRQTSKGPASRMATVRHKDEPPFDIFEPALDTVNPIENVLREGQLCDYDGRRGTLLHSEYWFEEREIDGYAQYIITRLFVSDIEQDDVVEVPQERFRFLTILKGHWPRPDWLQYKIGNWFEYENRIVKIDSYIHLADQCIWGMPEWITVRSPEGRLGKIDIIHRSDFAKLVRRPEKSEAGVQRITVFESVVNEKGLHDGEGVTVVGRTTWKSKDNPAVGYTVVHFGKRGQPEPVKSVQNAPLEFVLHCEDYGR